jgi:hypothetical protein
MLGFFPKLCIDYNWTKLVERVEQVAEYVHSQDYRNNIIYEDGASIVANVPEGGWISKSGPSHDFFVYGPIEELDTWFQQQFPELTFTPATVCYSSQNVPRHRDSPKNGQCSLVYPLHDNEGVGTVYGDNETFSYGTVKHTPVVINITKEHEVSITEKRIWFSIHMHESVEKVKEVFDIYASKQYTNIIEDI